MISADSMLVYRDMDIGTAKPTLEEMAGIPHHMIDIVNPNEEFSVATYQSRVEELINQIIDRGNLPLLVGGTGLYIRSVIDHYDFTTAPKDDRLRECLKREAEQVGAAAMHKKLSEVDPQSAERLHPNDLRRVIRALEVYYQTGKTIAEYQYKDQVEKPKYNLKMFGLTMDRQLLYQRIEQRVDLMMARGLLTEVKELVEQYNGLGTALQGLGYKEIIGYLKGEYSLPEAVEILKRNTRRFAKRQLTWFRADNRIFWIEMDRFENKKAVANEIMKQMAGDFLTL
ncbi:tRNA delta(2)-isopentenylpyrophosphate transferase [Desulforamulus reducens MI-1]|uniref:tRNA dimethylallyltransferase n=1 Tax=Desulforamulus reducens (strain ATCC BAA-1160 / DSM 100696 / MI-1) TaxID=349161 RepID=MIAA_DESRM|nr:RecName: Full=tRNA dimethylallyltransferase; AltName: Full=Dimethylallyl diphosphate:tRNA dimethylallyltransferase; Short=DMAPP:tRNA dimethylallyltransferase; Short=DMATase; AltName: Full=Isopentenyl-diphosphate:tRNA isopentenyltransferase; Short=IPP transferase; Short=IPPT; Short=IPTase [Desulforamulus reducens MI-1]ABO50404.1 tRNA delta(2)-isopentenylpyrophosphate transferase [Desulforamulus reducens MI-1]